jgi:hypothetical protein
MHLLWNEVMSGQRAFTFTQFAVATGDLYFIVVAILIIIAGEPVMVLVLNSLQRLPAAEV